MPEPDKKEEENKLRHLIEKQLVDPGRNKKYVRLSNMMVRNGSASLLSWFSTIFLLADFNSIEEKPDVGTALTIIILSLVA